MTYMERMIVRRGHPKHIVVEIVAFLWAVSRAFSEPSGSSGRGLLHLSHKLRNVRGMKAKFGGLKHIYVS
jgi:hypothetical protein